MRNNNKTEWPYRAVFGKTTDPGQRFTIAFCVLAFLYFFVRALI